MSTSADQPTQTPAFAEFKEVARRRELGAKGVEFPQAPAEAGTSKTPCVELEAELAAPAPRASVMEFQL